MRARLNLLTAAWAALLLAGCADETNPFVAPEREHHISLPPYGQIYSQWETQLPSGNYKEVTEVIPTDMNDPDYDNYIENQDFKTSRTVTLTWQDDHVLVDNTQEAKGVEVEVNGAYVVVRNLESEEGLDDARGKVTYRLTGTSNHGQLKVYSNKKFQLLLDGLSLKCTDGPAISIQHKKRCFVTLAPNSENYLSDNEYYASDQNPMGEDEKGCLFSEGQLIFGGEGRLMVHGRHQHGIASDEYVRVRAGSRIEVEAVKDGIHTKEWYHQTGGIVRSYAIKDALQSDSLGIRLSGGLLYLFGERGLTANGGGQVEVTLPGQMTEITY